MLPATRDATPVDHSLTYTSGGLKNIPHVARLRTILSMLDAEAPLSGASYADVGCSNGYVTSIVSERIGAAETVGFDHSEQQLAAARERHPDLEFRPIDLNLPPASPRRFDLVTCFEVLEHVGHLGNALDNLVAMTRPGGLLLVSVPIEVGVRGTAKFLAKTLIYRYRLDELPPGPNLGMRYLAALLGGRRMSAFRDARDGWGTHFGFDYRDVDDHLRSLSLPARTRNSVTTRFYAVRVPRDVAVD
jgi:SAM-dependent methyltransferase